MNTVSSKFLNTKLEYLGSIPQDRNASLAIIEQKPVVNAYPNSPASKAINELARKLVNNEQEEYKKKDGIAKVFLDFIKFKRRSR